MSRTRRGAVPRVRARVLLAARIEPGEPALCCGMRSAVVVLALVACNPRPGTHDEVAEGGAASPEKLPSKPAPPAEEPVEADASTRETVIELPPAASDDGPARERAGFAKALAGVTPGMAEAEVRKRLGPPDDIKTERDPGGISAARTVEVWRYGTNGHLTFGTLGTVHIQQGRTVQYVFGGTGTPMTTLAEAELRRLLRLLAAVPSYNSRFDPLRVIQAVNALQPLGKADALAVIDEFLRVSSVLDDPGREGVFMVLRTLFDPPTGQALPPMMVGGPSPAPKDERVFPRFPVVVVDDIPLTLTRGYILGGHAEQPEDHIRWYRTHATLRATPLHPPDAPLAAVDRAFAAGAPQAVAAGLDDDNGRVFVRDQALQLLDTVYRPRTTLFDESRFAYGPDTEPRWVVVRTAVERLGTRWDAARDLYVMAGDRLLTPAPRRLQPRTLWDLPLGGARSARMALEWSGPGALDTEVRVEVDAGGMSEPATLRLVDEATGTTSEIEVPRIAAPVDSTTGSVHTRRMVTKPGVRLRAELVVEGKVVASSAFTP